MRVRPFEFQRDYPDLCEWWRPRKDWTFVRAEALPRNGFVVENDEHKFAVVFLYLCEAQWGFLEWLTTNPTAPLKPRKEAIRMLVREALVFAKAAERRQVFSVLGNDNLIGLFEEQGFHRGVSGTELIWRA